MGVIPVTLHRGDLHSSRDDGVDHRRQCIRARADRQRAFVTRWSLIPADSHRSYLGTILTSMFAGGVSASSATWSSVGVGRDQDRWAAVLSSLPTDSPQAARVAALRRPPFPVSARWRDRRRKVFRHVPARHACARCWYRPLRDVSRRPPRRRVVPDGINLGAVAHRQLGGGVAYAARQRIHLRMRDSAVVRGRAATRFQRRHGLTKRPCAMARLPS